jgi:hypothetical protein
MVNWKLLSICAFLIIVTFISVLSWKVNSLQQQQCWKNCVDWKHENEQECNKNRLNYNESTCNLITTISCSSACSE